jgi:hypothetical protein
MDPVRCGTQNRLGGVLWFFVRKTLACFLLHWSWIYITTTITHQYTPTHTQETMLGFRIASTTVLVTALLAWTMPETQARFTPIVTYAPMTKVTDVAALDLDQNELERQLGVGALNNARAVYERGGNSLSIANLTLVNPPGPMSYPQGTQVLGRTKGSANTTVLGILVDESVTWGANPGNVTIHVQYVTSTNQKTYSDCQSGGLWTFSEANLNGCKCQRTGTLRLLPVARVIFTDSPFAVPLASSRGKSYPRLQ